MIYDLFKLFRMNKTMKCYEDFVVLPRKLVIDPIIDTGDGDSETLSQNNFSLDKNAFASIREYRGRGFHQKHSLDNVRKARQADGKADGTRMAEAV